jgi:hypothetical protein
MLWLALAASVAASGWLALQAGADDDGSLAVARSSVRPPAGGRVPAAPTLAAPAPAAAPPRAEATLAAADAAPATLPTRPADWDAPGPDALAAWQGTPPPAAPPAAPPGAPTAAARPPAAVFPYQWIGQLDDGGAPQVLLSSAQRSVGVRLGEVLDGRWRIELGDGGELQATLLASGEVLAVRGRPAGAGPRVP